MPSVQGDAPGAEKAGDHPFEVLYSKEKPVKTDPDKMEEDPGTRRSLPGSISFVPPVAGLLIAGEVIRDIAGL